MLRCLVHFMVGVNADRSPSSQLLPKEFDTGSIGAMEIHRFARVQTSGRIDARLIQSPNGLVVVLANYNPSIGQEVNLTIKGIGRNKKRVTSAYPFTFRAHHELR